MTKCAWSLTSHGLHISRSKTLFSSLVQPQILLEQFVAFIILGEGIFTLGFILDALLFHFATSWDSLHTLKVDLVALYLL